jgi:hypothetical protein
MMMIAQSTMFFAMMGGLKEKIKKKKDPLPF